MASVRPLAVSRAWDLLIYLAGLTLRQLTDNTRDGLARQELADSTQSIAEISQKLGYSEPTNFTRAFRRVSGRTPSRFREELLAGR